MNIHFGTSNAVKAIVDAVPLYGRDEFASATRSTVPMLSLLMHGPDLFSEIVRRLGFPNEYDLFLEYTVGPFGGRGRPSHTDVMLTAGKDSLAIEGKWTEPMYPAIMDWPKKGTKKTANQKAVLNGWLSVLGRRLGKTFDVADFDDTIYQMVHRPASAAFIGEKPRLAYFLFEPSPEKRAAKPDDIYRKLTDLWDRLGQPATFPFYVVEVGVIPQKCYEPLPLLQKGEEATSEAVCAALLASEPLFQFSGYRIRQVGQEGTITGNRPEAILGGKTVNANAPSVVMTRRK